LRLDTRLTLEKGGKSTKEVSLEETKDSRICDTHVIQGN